VRTGDQELDATALAKIDTELRNLREEETYNLTNDTYLGTASATADRAPPSARFACLRLPRYAADAPPATNADVAIWLNIRRTCDVDMGAHSSLQTVGTREADLMPAT
jgi:hypothetical protein